MVWTMQILIFLTLIKIFCLKKFDLITSIYSLDYHYDFKFYGDYLKKICSDETVIIFDTIRAEHFNMCFKM